MITGEKKFESIPVPVFVYIEPVAGDHRKQFKYGSDHQDPEFLKFLKRYWYLQFMR